MLVDWKCFLKVSMPDGCGLSNKSVHVFERPYSHGGGFSTGIDYFRPPQDFLKAEHIMMNHCIKLVCINNPMHSSWQNTCIIVYTCHF